MELPGSRGGGSSWVLVVSRGRFLGISAGWCVGAQNSPPGFCASTSAGAEVFGRRGILGRLPCCAEFSPWILRSTSAEAEVFGWRAVRTGVEDWRSSAWMGFRLSEGRRIALLDKSATADSQQPAAAPGVFAAWDSSLPVCELMFSIRNDRLAEWVAKN